MDLMSLLSQAQGGQVFNNLGNQFGLEPQQAQSGLAALLPALTAGMQKNTQSKGGMQSLMQALSGTRHEGYVTQADTLMQPQAVSEGNAILGHLFGSKDVSRSVAYQAADQTGIDAGTLKQMLPMVANLLMGTMSQQTSNLSAQQSGLGGLLKSVMGGGRQSQQSNLLGQLMGGGGSGGMDMLNMAAKFLR